MTKRTQLSVERAPAIGEAFGHYCVQGVVGSCSLGRLYVTEQHALRGVSHTVALMCVSAEIANTPYFRTLFSEAASIAPRLEHPNLVAIHEMGELEGTYFVGMEWQPAESVSSLLTRRNTGGPMPIDIAVSVVKQAANAVHYLHERLAAAALPPGLGHLELDPSNLFVTYHGTVKLLGLGLRPITGEPSASGEHRVPSGSPSGELSAPEEGVGLMDRRTDVFCLGAMLWACLTGQRPELALAGEHRHSSAPREAAPSRVRADVPQALDAIVMRALSRDPLDRFQTAQELSEVLERFLARRDFQATPRHIRRWLEQSFAAERASLPLDLARAHGAADRPLPAPATLRPRALWSTNRGSAQHWRRSSAPPPRSSAGAAGPFEQLPVSAVFARPSSSMLLALEPPTSALPRASTNIRASRAWPIAALLLCVVIAAGASLVLLSPIERSLRADAATVSAASERAGRLEVRSTPEGALVFVDGEPTGLRTPVLVKGLAVGRPLRLSVEKPGFASQEGQVELAAGTVVTRAFELVASDGFVRFAGVPAGARIYVDDVALGGEAGKPLRLSAGRHAVRVETQDALLFSGAVNVVPGEQTIELAGSGPSGPGASE
jgi:serine/threonine protein kinase